MGLSNLLIYRSRTYSFYVIMSNINTTLHVVATVPTVHLYRALGIIAAYWYMYIPVYVLYLPSFSYSLVIKWKARENFRTMAMLSSYIQQKYQSNKKCVLFEHLLICTISGSWVKRDSVTTALRFRASAMSLWSSIGNYKCTVPVWRPITKRPQEVVGKPIR